MNARERSYERSRAIRAHVTERISSGDWGPGERIPTERVLADQFEIARNTVRGVLRNLEREGLIVRHVGRGSFVADKDREAAASRSLDFSAVSPSEIMEVRLLVEPGMGDLAVLRATQPQIDRLRECLDRGEAAESWQDFERWDAEFHEALAAATNNHAIVDILKSVNEVRGHPVWGDLKKKSLTRARRKVYERQHRAILAALSKREAETARKAIERHLRTVRANLLGY